MNLAGERIREFSKAFIMLPPLDNEIFIRGFCWGDYWASVTDSRRLRLNDDIIEILNQKSVHNLWRFPDPTGDKFNLCPPQFHKLYLKLAQKNLPKMMNIEEAFRKYISVGKAAKIDKYNRITLTSACMEQAGIKIGSRVCILGVGYWYEVGYETS